MARQQTLEGRSSDPLPDSAEAEAEKAAEVCALPCVTLPLDSPDASGVSVA